jgi:5'-3' exonuclease
MGIPVYFKTLVSEHKNSILIKGKTDFINSLFLDLNCLIHPCCRGLTDETEMIEKILFEIGRLIEHTEVSDLLYIAIDGIAPKGKMKQQRQRRYRSALERKYSTESKWNTNAISPGTYFMEKLNIALRKYIKTLSIKVILSDSDERGEGEHKILHYVKKNTLKGRICIYGLDADLIMLSLVSRKEDIYLLRERTEYNIEDTEEEFIYLKIDSLKNHLLHSMNVPSSIDKDIVIDDYIFMCFLLGNDFMNHIPSLNLRYRGHDLLLSVYSKLQNRYQGYFQLIDHKLETKIHFSFLKEFIHELSLMERETMMKIISIRERQYKKIYNEYNEDFHNFKNYIMESCKDQSKGRNECVSMEDIYRFQYDSLSCNKDVTKMIENLPLLYSPNEKKVCRELTYDDNLCKDYLDSLAWTTKYYFDECINWRYCTQYNEAPLLGHFSTYLQDKHKFAFIKDNKEFSNTEQLSYIFPQDSHKLHKYPIESKEYNMMVHLSFNRYLWECHLDFI